MPGWICDASYFARDCHCQPSYTVTLFNNVTLLFFLHCNIFSIVTSLHCFRRPTLQLSLFQMGLARRRREYTQKDYQTNINELHKNINDFQHYLTNNFFSSQTQIKRKLGTATYLTFYLPHKIKSQTAFSHKNEFNALSMGQFLQLWNLEFIQAGPSRSADSAQFNFNSELLETTFFLYLTLASEMIIRAKSLHRNRNPQNAAKCGVFFFYARLPKFET